MTNLVNVRPATYSSLAVGGVGCLLLILIVRGAADWSEGLAIVFYGLVIGALGLSVIGGIGALRSRTIAAWERWFSLGVAAAVPSLIVVATYAVLDFLAHLN